MNGWNPNEEMDLDHRLAAIRLQGFMQQPKVQQASQKKKKNFLLDQISTIGGIGGGILGSLVTPLAGTAVGAGAGSALGEAIENAITGDKLTKNVAKEGALGAIFGAGPIKLLKGAGAGAKALAMGSEDVLGAASKAALTPLRETAGKALTGAADDLAVKNFRLTPTQLKNFKGLGEDAGQFARKYGFHTADDVVSKGINPLQQQFDDVVGSISGVSKEKLQKNLITKINKLASSAPSDIKASAQQLKAETENLLNGFGDVIDAKELNKIRGQFDSLVNYTEKAANPARYTVNKRMADGIRETLQQSDPTGTLKGVGRELQKVRKFAEYATKQAELGRGSLPMGLSNVLGAGVGAGSFGGPAGAMGGFAATQLINSPTGRKATMMGAEKLGSKLLASGAKAGGQSATGIATRVGGAGLINSLGKQNAQPTSLEDALLGTQSFENSMDTMSMNPTSINAPMNANMDASYQQTPQSSSPYTKENLLRDIKRDPKNADEYIKYFGMLDEIFGQPAEKPLNSTSAQTVSDLENGLMNLNELSGQFSQSGVNNPFIGAIRSKNPFDTEAQSIQANIARVKQVIGKALEGGVLRKEDEVKYAKILPTLNDTDATAQNKINAIANDLNRKLQLYKQSIGYGGGGATLEDALMQQGGY